MTASNGIRLALLSGVASLAFAHAASAAGKGDAPAAKGGDEVVVLAHKQQYLGDVPIKQLPQNVQVVDFKLLNQINITRLDNALELVSGVERQNNFGGLWDSFAIRGFAGDPNVPSGFLVNGFNGGRGFGGPRDASNIETIEVLKGPGSALFGRGEPGGTVNIITKKPQFSEAGYLSQSAGSFSTYRTEGDITGPATDWLALRLNGAYEQADSFRDFSHSKKWVVTPSFLVKLGSDTTLTYELEAVHQEVPMDRGVLAVNGKLGLIPASRYLAEPGDGPTKADVLGHQLQLAHDFGSNWTLLLGASARQTSLVGYSTQAELIHARQTLYVDGQTVSRERRYTDYRSHDLILRAELDGRFDVGPFVNHVLIGVDDEHFNLDEFQSRFRPPVVTALNFPSANSATLFNAINIYNPVYGDLPTPAQVNQNSKENDRAWGVYAQDQIDLTSQLKLRLGVRYDDFRQTITNFLTGHAPEQALTNVSPQVGLVYEPTNLISLYASYGKGFRPNTGFDVNNVAFAPEQTNSVEVGAKLQSPDRKFNATIAFYKMDKTHIITASPVVAGASIDIGRAKSSGIEFDVDGQFPGDIKGRFSYAYTDAKTSIPLLDPDFARPVPAGAPLLNIPKNSATLIVYRDFRVIDDHLLTIGGGVHYVDKQLGETAANFFLPTYTTVKLFASYAPTDRITLSADIENLLNKVYYPNSYSQLWINPGAPRTFSVKASYKF